jgi:predicted RNase H-like nuclease
MLIVGVDAATVSPRVGLARGACQDDRLVLQEAVLCARERSPADIVSDWLVHARVPALLAIDAPLGWPLSLAKSLVSHRAGEAIATPPNEMFRRATDVFIHRKLGKTPLDIGADRIARTAHAALALLGELRRRLAVPIPLAWSTPTSGIAAIEVYPAATLIAHGMRSSGYKAPGQSAERREILTDLQASIDIGPHESFLETHADVLDAAVCLVAAKDFLDGFAMGPENVAVARTEGWIWARSPRGEQQ